MQHHSRRCPSRLQSASQARSSLPSPLVNDTDSTRLAPLHCIPAQHGPGLVACCHCFHNQSAIISGHYQHKSGAGSKHTTTNTTIHSKAHLCQLPPHTSLCHEPIQEYTVRITLPLCLTSYGGSDVLRRPAQHRHPPSPPPPATAAEALNNYCCIHSSTTLPVASSQAPTEQGRAAPTQQGRP